MEKTQALRMREHVSYQKHIIQLRHQLAAERESNEALRAQHEEEVERIQKDALNTLRGHLHGLQAVYHQTSWNNIMDNIA